jgi:hypothetical protein
MINRLVSRAGGIVAVGLMGLFPAGTLAQNVEQRAFAVLVDGKPAGQYTMSIASQPDGSTVMTAQASVQVRYLVYRYHYTFSGREIWKDGRLVELNTSCDDDGKKFRVTARPDGANLRVSVNGQEHQVRSDVWTTTYWRLAGARFRNQEVPLVDADTGRPLQRTLHYAGQEQANVAGQLKTCTRYRLTGDVTIDLWYDDQDRLVRQDGVEDGHRTILELRRIQR